MTPAASFPLCSWLAFWRFMQGYFRYEIDGFEYLETGRPVLIVGYHGRPAAADLAMLSVTMYDRLGYIPHGIVNRMIDIVPGMESYRRALGIVTGDTPELQAYVARGEHVVVTPGGGRESTRGFWTQYRVDWGNRVGYLKLALRHGLDIVPAAASGVDRMYIGLTSAEAIGRPLGLPSELAALPWLAFGPLGFFPFSPPFPVKIRQLLGPPIDLRDVDPDDESQLQAINRHVQGRVQALLDRAVGRTAAKGTA